METRKYIKCHASLYWPFIAVIFATCFVNCYSVNTSLPKRCGQNAFESYIDKFSTLDPADSICMDCIVFNTNTNDTSIQLGKRYLPQMTDSYLPLFKTFPTYIVTCQHGYLAFLLHYYDSGILLDTYIEAINYNLDGKIIDRILFPVWHEYGGHSDGDAIMHYSSLSIKDSIVRYSFVRDSTASDTICYRIKSHDATLTRVY